MSTTATAIQQSSTTSNVQPTIKMNPSYPQGHSPVQQQGPQFPSGQQQFPSSVPPPSFPNGGYQQFPQQQFHPQQQQQQQLAQWAYQQMMFQQQLAFQPQGPMQQQPYISPSQQQAMQMQYLQQQQQAMMQQQMAQQRFPQPPNPPYARENNGSHSSLHSSNGSVKSASHGGNGRRQRTTSNKSSSAHQSNPHSHSRSRTNSGASAQPTNTGRASPAVTNHPPAHRSRVSSTGSHGSAAATSANGASLPRSHSSQSSGLSTSRSASSSSTASSNATTSPSTSGAKPVRQPSKPSPLSQGSFGTSEEKKPAGPAGQKPAVNDSRPVEAVPTPAMLKSGGLKGRLKRALSFSALDEAHSDPKDASRRKAVSNKLAAEGQAPPRTSAQIPRPSTESSATLAGGSSTAPTPVAYVPTEGSIRSTDTAQAPKKSRSLFNAKFNRSTDNMSLSSTVSSASVMIRKLGSVGKLVRRNSLMGISNMFKDKKKDRAGSDGEAEDDKKKGKSKKLSKSAKSGKAEATVSHATVEVEPVASLSPDTAEGELAGLSPAAKLARQHTLRTRAAEAARAKAEREAGRAMEGIPEESNGTPSTWEKNTATRAAVAGAPRRSVNDVGEWNGSDDELSDDDGTFDGHHIQQPPQTDWRHHMDDDSDEDAEQHDEYGYDEDDTVRLGDAGYDEEADEPWAIGLRRSVEKTRQPAKGILKNAEDYTQTRYLEGGPPQAPFMRVRSNSNDSAPPMGAEPGPLARIPSPDPDHIDGLHRSNSGSDRHSFHSRKLSTSSAGSGHAGLLPNLNFEDGDAAASLASTLSAFGIAGGKERPLSGHSGTFSYKNPDFNASAPALGASNSSPEHPTPNAPTLTTRSATVPLTKNSKKLTFAANLSVYHTFSPNAYDRRSEPATCNRLTPALAQRIKEELNSYKMEEMEVHAASRMHTHFFV